MNKQKQTIGIETYFYCEYCDDIMGRPIKIGKLYLSNSFHYFLYLLSEEPLSSNKIKMDENMTASKRKISTNNRKLSLDYCKHESLVRVFQYEGILIKFIVTEV